jgi:hypothetical protein
MEARTSKGDRGSSRANKGDKYCNAWGVTPVRVLSEDQDMIVKT